MPDTDRVPRTPISARGGAIEARYGVAGPRTALLRLHEQGALRLRQPAGPSCQSVVVNTAGGIAGGDRLSISFDFEVQSDVTITSAAAEKVYRSDDPFCASTLEARFNLAPDSRLIWVPQETILFNSARLRRRFVADLDATSALTLAEMLVFGRREHGEHDIAGHLHDSWRLRRDGHLVFADETRLDGPIGRLLVRNAIAGGSHATALILVAGPQAPACLAPARAAIAAATASGGSSTGGASLKNGIIVARLLATSAERLRSIVAATLQAMGVAIPRVWQ